MNKGNRKRENTANSILFPITHKQVVENPSKHYDISGYTKTASKAYVDYKEQLVAYDFTQELKQTPPVSLN